MRIPKHTILAGLIFYNMATFAQSSASMTVNMNDVNQVIHKEIYGMFSEHLGADIYGGFWVGKHSAIPNKDAIWLDIVDALKKIKVPVLR